jgi:hypothetical protein
LRQLIWILAMTMTSIGVCATVACGQQLPSNEEAAGWIAKAIGEADIGRGWPKSYELTARVRYELDGIASEGTIEIRWAAKDRHRLDLQLGELSSTELALEDKYYTLRPQKGVGKEPAIQRFLIADLIFHPLKELMVAHGQISGVQLEAREGVTRFCVDAASDRQYAREACFESKTLKVVSVTIRDQAKYTNDLMATVMELSDFIDEGKVRYPKHMQMHFLVGKAEIDVSEFKETDTFQDGAFVAPAGAQVRDWCAKPEVVVPERAGQPGHTSRASFMPVDLIPPIFHASERVGSRYSSYQYILVGPDGRPEVETPVVSAVTGRQLILRGESYPVHSCNGKGIEYEMVSAQASSRVQP